VPQCRRPCGVRDAGDAKEARLQNLRWRLPAAARQANASALPPTLRLLEQARDSAPASIVGPGKSKPRKVMFREDVEEVPILVSMPWRLAKVPSNRDMRARWNRSPRPSSAMRTEELSRKNLDKLQSNHTQLLSDLKGCFAFVKEFHKIASQMTR